MPPPVQAPELPQRPVLLYDGECAFCQYWVECWRPHAARQLEFLALQSPATALRFPELRRDDLERSVHFVDCDGTVVRGAEAVFRTLSLNRKHAGWHRGYETSDTFAEASEAAYAFVASHRRFFSILFRLLP